MALGGIQGEGNAVAGSRKSGQKAPLSRRPMSRPHAVVVLLQQQGEAVLKRTWRAPNSRHDVRVLKPHPKKRLYMT